MLAVDTQVCTQAACSHLEKLSHTSGTRDQEPQLPTLPTGVLGGQTLGHCFLMLPSADLQ